MSFDSPTLPPIEFVPAGESTEQSEANLALVEPSPGFRPAANLCVEIIARDADVTVLDFTAQQVNVRYRMDGIWHNGPQLERERGDYMLATLKQMAGLNYRERRQRQQGAFKTIYMKRGQKFKIVSQGVPTGERVAIYLDYKRPSLESAAELGMRPKMQQQIQALIADPNMGNLMVVAVPGEGYTSAWKGVVGCADRLTRDFYVLQPVGKGEAEEVINVFPVEFDPASGQDAMSPVPQLLLKQPDVLAFPDLPSGDLVNRITQLSVDQSMPIFTRHPGKTCLDGLLRLIVKQPDVAAFVKRLDGIVAMRVVRKLCSQCRVPYNPHPQLLQQLGLPQGRIAELYQPLVFKPGMVDENEDELEPCGNCSGIGFRGRTGVFEFLRLTDPIRQAIVRQPRMDYLQKVAASEGHVSMYQEGVLLVAKGTTSVDELNRVLKA